MMVMVVREVNVAVVVVRLLLLMTWCGRLCSVVKVVCGREVD